MRLLDRIQQRYGDTYNEYQYSGAQLVSSYATAAKTELPNPNYETCKRVYLGNGVVFAAILARMQLFSQVKFVFRNDSDGKLEDLPNRAQILENPWPGGTTSDLLGKLLQDADIAGNAYLWSTGDPDQPLVRLEPQMVQIVSEILTDGNGRHYRKVRGYWWDPKPTGTDQPSEDAEFFTTDEVAHWAPIQDPSAHFRGISWLTSVLDEITADGSLTAYKLKYMQQAATPNMVLHYKQRLQKETIDALRERMQARYGGVDNAFKTLILDQGADLQVVGANLGDMNFTDVQAAGETRILMAAGVPGIVVGAKEGLQAATYSNYQLAMRRFADVTITPLWQGICSCLEDTVISVPQGKRLWFDPKYIPALQQNMLERAQATQVTAAAIDQLAKYNFDPDSIIAFMATGDVTQLTHKGPLVSSIATVPTVRPDVVHLDVNGNPLPPKPTAAVAAPAGQNRLPAGAAATKPVAGKIGPTGGTSKPGPNGKTAVSASRK